MPTAFYRHFDSMDELGLALVEESFRTLRAMLRDARESPSPQHIINRSVEILVEHVRQHRQHFVFVARVGSTGNVVLRHAIRNEIRLLHQRAGHRPGPASRAARVDDRRPPRSLAGLLVNTMIATVGAMVDAPVAAPEAEAEIAWTAEKQLRMIMLGVPHWRSG